MTVSRVLKERDEEIRELTAALKETEESRIAPAPIFPPLSDVDAPRRSRRLASSHRRDADHESVELEQCRAELDLKQTELRLKTLGKLQQDSKRKPLFFSTTDSSLWFRAEASAGERAAGGLHGDPDDFSRAQAAGGPEGQYICL